MIQWDTLLPGGPVHKEKPAGWHVEHVMTPLADGDASYQHNRRFSFAQDETGRPYGSILNFGTYAHAQTVQRNIARCAAGPVFDFIVPMAGGGSRVVQVLCTPTQIEEVTIGLTLDKNVRRAGLLLRCARDELRWPADALPESWQTFAFDSGGGTTDIDVRLIGVGIGWAYLVFANRLLMALSWSAGSGWSCRATTFSTSGRHHALCAHHH